MPSPFNLIFELLFLQNSGGDDFLTFWMLLCVVSSAGRSYFIVKLLVTSIHLLPILSCEIGHFVLIDEIIVNFLLNQFLIVFLEIGYDLRLFSLELTLRISKIILSFRDELNTHFINLKLLLKSTLVCGEIVFDGWISTSPS